MRRFGLAYARQTRYRSWNTGSQGEPRPRRSQWRRACQVTFAHAQCISHRLVSFAMRLVRGSTLQETSRPGEKGMMVGRPRESTRRRRGSKIVPSWRNLQSFGGARTTTAGHLGAQCMRSLKEELHVRHELGRGDRGRHHART